AQRTKTSAANQLQWQIALAQYREAISDPGAKDAWVALAEAHPNDAAIQSMIVTSAASAGTDREFFSRTIDRLRASSPENAQLWKVAKAQWLLASARGSFGGPERSDED